MANISTFLQKIMEAVYGEEVRSSIHDALAAMNVESSDAMRFAATAKDSAAASALDAKASAATAKQKADEIVVSAQAAKTSETNAKTSETNAVAKAAEAVAAAAGAKASETAAGNSEAVAAQKAREAADSQSAAAQSEAEAKAAEERTKTIRSDVETLGAQATADKNAAEAAKEAAEGAAGDATIAETNAKLSENAALVAQAAAEVAKDDAEAAKLAAQTAADNASTDADDAAQAAADAAASALSAQQYSGKPPKPQDGTWWIWDAAQQKYLDSGISCDLVGPTGNGIQDIKLTKGDHTPGTTDIYTVTMTDGTTTTISVYNGRNGTGAGDVLGISFDLVLPTSGWVNGELTVADSRLLALSTHKYLVDADEASREEYLECNVQARNITTTGFITFKNDTDPTTDLTVNVIRLELSANGA